MLLLLNGKWRNYLRTAVSSPRYWLAYNFSDGRAFRPLNVDWELTFRCNLRCVMCPQELYKSQSGKPRSETTESELSFDEMKSVVDDLAKMKVEVITLTGGEPFLHPHAAQIAQYIKQRGMACNILSNGGVLTKKLARQIVDAKVDALTFSLDGPQKVHDMVRNRKGCFDKLCQSVELIRRLKKDAPAPSLAFNCTISSLNQTCFSELLDVAKDLQVPTVNFAFLFFSSEKAISDTSELIDLAGVKEENQILPDYLKSVDTGLIKEQLDLCVDKGSKYGICVNIMPPLAKDELDKYFNDDSYSYCSKCFFPWYASRINPYGAVYPCSIDYSVGNIRRQPFSTLWNSRTYCNFRRKLKKIGLFPKCKKCCMLNNKLWDLLPRF